MSIRQNLKQLETQTKKTSQTDGATSHVRELSISDYSINKSISIILKNKDTGLAKQALRDLKNGVVSLENFANHVAQLERNLQQRPF